MQPPEGLALDRLCRGRHNVCSYGGPRKALCSGVSHRRARPDQRSRRKLSRTADTATAPLEIIADSRYDKGRNAKNSSALYHSTKSYISYLSLHKI